MKGGTLVALIAALLVTQSARASWEATPGEIVALPRFCWQQFKAATGPEYSLPPKALCGSAMNHYCPGLVDLIRAKRSVGNPKERVGNLRKAKNATLYTLRAMEEHPKCPLRSHAESTLNEVEMLLRLNVYR
jgi:hypothetical protein